MPLSIKECTIAELLAAPNSAAILEAYAAECAIEGLPKPVAKLDMYKVLQESGGLRVIGAFIGDILAGYITILASIMPHYGIVIAVTESFFVAPAYRRTGAGLMLLNEAEAYAKSVGCPGLLVSAPFGGNLAEVLPHRGYEETNRVFFKGFDNG